MIADITKLSDKDLVNMGKAVFLASMLRGETDAGPSSQLLRRIMGEMDRRPSLTPPNSIGKP